MPNRSLIIVSSLVSLALAACDNATEVSDQFRADQKIAKVQVLAVSNQIANLRLYAEFCLSQDSNLALAQPSNSSDDSTCNQLAVQSKFAQFSLTEGADNSLTLSANFITPPAIKQLQASSINWQRDPRGSWHCSHNLSFGAEYLFNCPSSS